MVADDDELGRLYVTAQGIRRNVGQRRVQYLCQLARGILQLR